MAVNVLITGGGEFRSVKGVKNPPGKYVLLGWPLYKRKRAQDACAYLLARPKIDIRPLALSRTPRLNISSDSAAFPAKTRRDIPAELPLVDAVATLDVASTRS